MSQPPYGTPGSGAADNGEPQYNPNTGMPLPSYESGTQQYGSGADPYGAGQYGSQPTAAYDQDGYRGDQSQWAGQYGGGQDGGGQYASQPGHYGEEAGQYGGAAPYGAQPDQYGGQYGARSEERRVGTGGRGAV